MNRVFCSCLRNICSWSKVWRIMRKVLFSCCVSVGCCWRWGIWIVSRLVGGSFRWIVCMWCLRSWVRSVGWFWNSSIGCISLVVR